MLSAGRLWRSAFGFLCLVRTQASMRHLFLVRPCQILQEAREAAFVAVARGKRSLPRVHIVPIWERQNMVVLAFLSPPVAQGPVVRRQWDFFAVSDWHYMNSLAWVVEPRPEIGPTESINAFFSPPWLLLFFQVQAIRIDPKGFEIPKNNPHRYVRGLVSGK